MLEFLKHPYQEWQAKELNDFTPEFIFAAVSTSLLGFLAYFIYVVISTSSCVR